MQASFLWVEPVGTLGGIVREAMLRARTLESGLRALENKCDVTSSGASLRAALRQPTVGLLTEIKRKSPSRGAIAPELDAIRQARAYAAGGAAGISVLTEPNHFGGSIDDLTAVIREAGLPVLKKDFHVAPIQIIEARSLGASAALLIVRAVSPTRFVEMMRLANELRLELLVEVRDEAELERALAEGATMIGVNNRNLETLVIDPATAERLIPMIPAHVVAVAESGVKTRADVERYAAVGADAVLVGSSLSAATDPVAATRALGGVQRSDRAR